MVTRYLVTILKALCLPSISSVYLRCKFGHYFLMSKQFFFYEQISIYIQKFPMITMHW